MVPTGLLVGLLASVAVGAGVAHAVPIPSDVLPLGDVKPGMKGYGLTVFSGTTPERFDIEVISTLHSFRPNQDLILVKTPNHPRLDIARTVAGMSGSPIYLNGKMIGAYAYGWLFGSEAIAGVTPIESMLQELARPLPAVVAPKGAAPLPGAGLPGGAPRGTTARTWGLAPERWDLAEHARRVAARSSPALAPPHGTALAPAATPVMLGGMSDVAVKLATEMLAPMGLEPLQAGGSKGGKPDASAPTRFVDGGAIGVELVRGDISAMGLGTVTRVSGDKLLAFGHPMLNGGIEALPTAIGRVHWILATQNRSFKIGEAVRPLGTLVNDRQAAIVVDQSVKAPTFPMRFRIEGVEGAPKPAWDLEVAHDQFMGPMFAAMALGSAAETTTAERRDMTWRATSKLKLAKYPAITLADMNSGIGNPIGPEDFARSRLVRAVGMLMNNPWEDVTIESVETTMQVRFSRDIFTLRGAKVMEPEIDVGQSAHVRLELQPVDPRYRGKIETRTLEIPIPKEMAGRDVDIEIAPGYEVERPQPTPDSVAQLLAMLPDQSFDWESVVATIRLRDSGAAYRGKMASRLPAGALDTLRPSTDSEAPETFAAQSQTPFPMQKIVVGRDTVRVKVRQILR